MEGHVAATVACSDYSTKPQQAKEDMLSAASRDVLGYCGTKPVDTPATCWCGQSANGDFR